MCVAVASYLQAPLAGHAAHVDDQCMIAQLSTRAQLCTKNSMRPKAILHGARSEALVRAHGVWLAAANHAMMYNDLIVDLSTGM